MKSSAHMKPYIVSETPMGTDTLVKIVSHSEKDCLKGMKDYQDRFRHAGYLTEVKSEPFLDNIFYVGILKRLSSCD